MWERAEAGVHLYFKTRLLFRLHHSNARLTGCVRRRTLTWSPPILLREAFHRENATGETRGATHIWISRKFVAEVLSCSSCSSLALPVAAMVAAGFQGLSPSVFL